MSKQLSKKEWADMSAEERAKYCEDQADLLGAGFCRDNYRAYARAIRVQAGIETK
jgi:hypothetical protein